MCGALNSILEKTKDISENKSVNEIGIDECAYIVS